MWNILDIEKLGRFIKKINSNIIFLIDACQSAGHLKLNAKKNMCDALVCSGRKYLRGPRGTGLIFIKDSIQKKITPKPLRAVKLRSFYETIDIDTIEDLNLARMIERSKKI